MAVESDPCVAAEFEEVQGGAMAIKIAVINFKGGVGKTTLAFHLATYLARADFENKRVLVVDVDHQSSLSIVVLGEKL